MPTEQPKEDDFNMFLDASTPAPASVPVPVKQAPIVMSAAVSEPKKDAKPSLLDDAKDLLDMNDLMRPDDNIMKTTGPAVTLHQALYGNAANKALY